MTNFASIDLGSHTARLLVSQKIGPSGVLRPLVRKRVYTRLAEGFDDQGRKTIKQEAIDRTLNALQDFASITKKFNVDSPFAVSTGVVRKAVNKDRFLNRIYDHTGINVKVISGEEEAHLTKKGVLHSLNIRGGPFMIFDLGGGSTEFIFGGNEATEVKSIPLGAMTLTQRFLNSDPPEESRLKALERFIDEALSDVSPPKKKTGDGCLVVGTGGTVTTLAAMIYGFDVKDISPDRMNGLNLERERLEDLFSGMRTMTLRERMSLPGLDQGRADVILAGSMVVIRILHSFKCLQMVVCLSDLLEGVLIASQESKT